MAKRGPGGRFAKQSEGEAGRSAMAQGIGESRIFADPNAKETRDWASLTVNGQPIPEHLHGVMPYDLTDQAAEERILNRVHEPSGIEFGRAPEEKAIDAYGDGLRAGMEPFESPDAFREIRDQHIKPGERARYLSPRVIETQGLRGWEPVMALKNGIRQVVKVGNMILGRMPEQVARRRDQRMRERAREQMVAAVDQTREATEQIQSLAATDRAVNRRARRGDDVANEGFTSRRGDEFEMEDRDFVRVGDSVPL